jgi:adenylate cyclase
MSASAGLDRIADLPLVRRLAELGCRPDDSDELRLRKQTLVLVAGSVIVLAVIWVAIYLVLDRPLAAAIPFGYQVVELGAIAWFAQTKRFAPFRALSLGLMLVLPFALQWVLGGFVNSSVVCLWSLTTALSALFFYGARGSLPWFGGFLVLLVISGALDPGLAASAEPLPGDVRLLFFVLNVGCVAVTLFLLVEYFVVQRERALALSDGLLLNVLPAPIAARLKHAPVSIAETHPDVSVLFADVVDFTPYAERTDAHDVIALLDDIFTRFDALADRHGVEKIKTIGDAYMAVAGLPVARPDHVEAITSVALAMLDEVEAMCVEGREVAVRIGIDAGPVIAGVIGRRKFIYDLWGDTVNTAARMESHGVAGRIQVTARFAARIAAGVPLDRGGIIEVKGKGALETWLLARREPAPPGATATPT